MNARRLNYGISKMAAVSECWGCKEKTGWGILVSPASGGPALSFCKECAKDLLERLLSEFLEVRKGGVPETINSTPMAKATFRLVDPENVS